jgi:Uma2 family endonuclease
MAESDLHRQCMVDAIETLEDHFAAEPDVYVSGDLLLYYEEGNWRRSVAPDVFVVWGVAKGHRDIYKLWEEGVPPAWVLEVTSRTTRREDVRTKRNLYTALGVTEYFLFDPRGDYLRPVLQGYALRNGGYMPIQPEPLPDGALVSRTLGLRLHAHGETLRFSDPRTGALLPTRQEARRAAEQARQAAEARAATAETELARLRAELARLQRPD